MSTDRETRQFLGDLRSMLPKKERKSNSDEIGEMIEDCSITIGKDGRPRLNVTIPFIKPTRVTYTDKSGREKTGKTVYVVRTAGYKGQETDLTVDGLPLKVVVNAWPVRNG